MITMNLFQTIQKRKKHGLGIRQISRELQISRKTVRKYFRMELNEYVKYKHHAYQKPHVFSRYRNEILEIYQRNKDKVYASSVYDLLEEKYGTNSLPGSPRTLRNFISHLNASGEVLNSNDKRYYTPVEELPFGKQLQVDFGQTRITSGEVIYIFAAVLSASRYRYASVQDRPFKSLDVILHLQDCFEYIGGIPKQLVIDQDKTMVVSENSGDILYTEKFSEYKAEMAFNMHVCRKSDPESKGKVENLVKFIKTSFFSARSFTSIDDVKTGLFTWLQRTANGKISQATGMIPANLLSQEQKAFNPLRASLFKRDNILEREERRVDEKNLISVGSSRYSVPAAYRKKKVWIYRSKTDLIIYEDVAGKEIARHTRSLFPHQKVMNKSHFQDMSLKPVQLKDNIKKKVSLPGWPEYIEENYQRYSRYFREQHKGLMKFLGSAYDRELLQEALELCRETDGYSAENLKESYIYVQGVHQNVHDDIIPALVSGIQAVKADKRNPLVAKRDLSFYHSVVSILGVVL